MAREQERGCLAQHGSPARSRVPARCAVNIAWARRGKRAAGLLRAPPSWCRGEMQSLSLLLLSVPETPPPAGNALKQRRETGDQGSDSPSGHQVFFYPLFLPHSRPWLTFSKLCFEKCWGNPLGVDPEPSAGWEAGEKEKQAGTIGIMRLPCKAGAAWPPLPRRGLSAPSRKSKEEKQRTLPRGRALGVCQTPQLTFGQRPFQLLEFCHRFIFMGRLLFFLLFFNPFT